MNINDAPIYDFGAWIALAPDFDWSKLGGGGDPAPDPDPDPSAGLYTADYRATY